MHMPLLDNLIHQLATVAIAEGVAHDSHVGGECHRWVVRNVDVRNDQHFCIVFLLSVKMANLRARAQGYEGTVDRTFSMLNFTPPKLPYYAPGY